MLFHSAETSLMFLFLFFISSDFYRSSNTLQDLRGIHPQKRGKTIQL